MNDESLNEVTENLKDTNVWIRLLYMILFWIIYCVAEVVLGAIVVFQFLFVLFSSNRNEKLLAFGGQLSTFIYQVLRFLTFNSETRPYPFDEWPEAEAAQPAAVEVPTAQAEKSEAPAAETKAEEPVAKPAEKPKAATKPAAKKPAAKKPVAKKPVAKKPTEEKGGDSEKEEKQ